MNNKEARQLMIHYIIARFFTCNVLYEQWFRELWWWKYRENLNLIHEPIIEICKWLKDNLIHIRVYYAGDRFSDEQLTTTLDKIIAEL